MSSSLMANYGRFDLTFERGEGSYLYTADGARYLDFGCGIGVTSLGHAHPHVVAALEAQSRELWHVSNLYHIPPQARLAERLSAATFADRVLFCNSGAEAMECAIKLARIHQTSRGAPETCSCRACAPWRTKRAWCSSSTRCSAAWAAPAGSSPMSGRA